MPSAEEVMKSSLAEFSRELQPPSLFEKFLQTRLHDLKLKILEIQTSQERRKSMTDFSRIKSFIRAFDGFAETFCLTSEQTACVWGPVKYVLHVVKDDVKALDEILQSYRGLGTRIPSVVPYTSLVTERPEVSICLAYMYKDLLQFQKCLLKLFAGHDWKATFHTNWRYYHNDSFQDVLKSFDQHGKALEDLLRAHHYQQANEHRQITSDMSQRLNNHLQNYQNDRQDLEIHIRRYEEDRDKLLHDAEEQEKHRKNQRSAAYKKWVSAPGLQESFHSICKGTRAEFPGTTDWIVKHDVVNGWIHEDPPEKSILCLSGKKGAGKTILASRLIDYCKEHLLDFKTSFFYCREDDPNQNSCLAIYKWLLIQMLDHHEDLLPSCYEKTLKGSEMLNDETVARALIGLFCNADLNQFIIIDGIDEIEAPQRKPLLQFFAGLVDKCDAYKPGKVRVMFLGHDLADYQQLKCMESATIMRLEQKIIKRDIELFVATKAKELKEKFSLTDEELHNAQVETMKHSDGMFLFATLVMDYLLEQPTVECLKGELKELETRFPEDLREAYHKVISRLRRDLGENQWRMTTKIFGWLACAKRPLNWHEIQAALSMVIHGSGSSFVMDYHNKQLRDDIRAICGSLVQKIGNRIMFSHSTAKLFIVNTQDLNEIEIECSLARICLRYLSSQCFRKGLSETQLKDLTRQGYYAFQDYALAKWGHHLEAVIKAGPHELDIRSAEDFSQVLSHFATVYRTELSITTDAEERILRAKQDCREFANCDFYEVLVIIWAHFSQHQLAHFKERNKSSLPTLGALLKSTRTILETFGTSNKAEGGIEEIKIRYGEFLFKCDRFTCDYFYEGFETKEARDNHLKRHDRPYHCPIPGCSVNAFGFSTNKDREKHIRQYHPDETSESRFTHMPRELVEDARFACPDCGQTFTRKANKDAHVRSHYGERPYVCDVCDKAFTRSNDRRRHIRDIHSRKRG
ncbi:hypothetical protein F5Y08DRAFT_21916 [Xylaria arbuscula]|nr:hypothetical protein F5Y08DRAFT_21916 [Xylaria arbuscula]